MSIIVIIFEILACIYIGEILGLYIQCENTPYLKSIRFYCFLVPIVRVAIFYSCAKEATEKQRPWLLNYFIFSGEISSIILCVFADLQPQIRAQKQRRKLLKVAKQFNKRSSSPFSISLLIEKCIFEVSTLAE